MDPGGPAASNVVAAARSNKARMEYGGQASKCYSHLYNVHYVQNVDQTLEMPVRRSVNTIVAGILKVAGGLSVMKGKWG